MSRLTRVLLVLLLVLAVLGAAGYFGISKYFENRLKTQLEPVQAFAEVTYSSFKFDFAKRASVLSEVMVRPSPMLGAPVQGRVDQVVISYDISWDVWKPKARERAVSMDNVILRMPSAMGQGQPMAVRIGKLAVDGLSTMPETGSMKISNLTLPTEQMPKQALAMLNQFGYKPSDVKFNMEMDYTMNMASEMMDLRKFYVGMPNAGSFDMKMQASELMPMGGGMMGPAQYAVNFNKLHSARILYTDESLIKRIIKREADNAGMEYKQYLEKLLAEIDALIAQVRTAGPGAGAFTAESLTAIKDFLQDPGTLVVTMKPDSPVDVNSLNYMSPYQVAQTLNMRIIRKK